MADVQRVLGEMKLCVLIPAHNEANAIAGLVDGVHAKGLDVVVVDDGSTDRTSALAKEKGAYVIVHPEKKGKGLSLQDGFKYVLSQGYDGVVMMDGDGQHAVEDLNQFISLALKDPQSVITGNRMNDVEKMPPLRLWTNRFMSGLISLACGQKIPDTQCGFRYIGAGVLKQLPLLSGEFEIETEILMKAAKRKIPIHSVAIQTIYQNEVSKIRPVKDTLRFIVYFIREIFSGK
jgi:glycosyltransferase involved in cell wall biosynthesis